MKSSDVITALARTYKQPEWAFFTEVADATGARATRRIDALAMNMWPSRGLEIRAIEVKVSRSDLKRELDNPAKAEALARFANSFYIAAPVDLWKGMDVPEPWGILGVSANGAVAIKRKAAYNDSPTPITKEFTAALLRSAAQQDEGAVRSLVGAEVARQMKLIEERMERQRQDRLRHSRARGEQLVALDAAMTEVFGEGHRQPNIDKEFLQAVKLVTALGLTEDERWSGVGRIRRLLDDLVKVAAASEAALNAFDLEVAQKDMARFDAPGV